MAPPTPTPTPSPARTEWLSRLRPRKEAPSTGVKKEKRKSGEKGAFKANGSGSGSVKEKAERPLQQTGKCAEVALYCWNRNRKQQGLSEYVVVKAMCSIGFMSAGHMFHANFTARPRKDPSAEPELFFAELKGDIYKKKYHTVPVVCSLGPASSVTGGLNGCRACGSVCKHSLLCHPEGGFCLGSPVYLLSNRHRKTEKN